jgi:hypothetical protein
MAPNQSAKGNKHRGEQPRRENIQNSRQYCGAGEQVKNPGRHRPELLSRGIHAGTILAVSFRAKKWKNEMTSRQAESAAAAHGIER